MNQSPQWSVLPEHRTIWDVWTDRLSRIEGCVQIVGTAAMIGHFGVRQLTDLLRWEIGCAVVASLIILTLSLALRYRWNRAKGVFLREHRFLLSLYASWLLGAVLIPLALWISSEGGIEEIGKSLLFWSEFVMLMSAGSAFIELTRRTQLLGWSPAFLLALSFFLLIVAGTCLLMLPATRSVESDGESLGERFIVALFTATSASCVTGLTVVDTGTYWSRTGHHVILCLFQIGGLGIMTFGGFFALVSGRAMQVREGVMLSELFESEHVGSVQRLVVEILLFTFTAEFVGVVVLSISGVWADLPWSERLYYSLFHSISAFCNAGFSVIPGGTSFVGLGHHWSVWGGITGLVIVGGLGFRVLHDLGGLVKSRLRAFAARADFIQVPFRRFRLSVTSTLVLVTTTSLLAGGTIVIYLLEWNGVIGQMPIVEGVSAAWFQSVILRTAGFNSVDIGALQPGTKFFAILLMFVGASPVSTGGGVKTVCFALTLIALFSIMRGRDHVEILGRTIPDPLVKRASSIIALGMIVVMLTTLSLVIVENQPAKFLDHLFEATSAFATVGVSTGVTPGLKPLSKLIIIVTMFIGRVGPLTLLVAVAGKFSTARYQYPYERVTLG